MVLGNKKILITGGAGFLGSNLTQTLSEKGAQVIVVDNFSRDGSKQNFETLKKKFPALKSFAAEISDIPLIVSKEKPDLIYHFAAQVAVTHSVNSPVSDFRINAEGTFMISHAAHMFDIPVIYSSTNKVYGDNVNKVPIKEEDTRYDFDSELQRIGISENFSIDAQHHTPYGCSKLAGELYVREFGGVVNRCSCMYGTYQHGIVDQGWLSFFITQKLNNKPATIFGDGKQVRDAVHASDVVDLLVTQGERIFNPKETSICGEVFNVGGGYTNTISLLELCSKLGIKPQFSDWRPADQKVFYCDIDKAKQFFNWEPKISLNDGLTELVEWTAKALNVPPFKIII